MPYPQSADAETLTSTCRSIASYRETVPFTTQIGNCREVEVLRRACPSQVTLSVVVPNYNTSSFVGAAIASVLSQTFRDLEVIVVDDGSGDDSIERILSFSDPRLTCVKQTNHGLAASRNTGIYFARGRYIGFLDSDDIWDRAKADTQLQLMMANPEVGVTFSWSEYLTEAGEPTGKLLVSTCSCPNARQLAVRNHLGNGSTAIVRRECFDQAGMFDETLRSCEDLELWVRIAALTKWQFRMVAEPLTSYRIRQGSLSLTFDSLNSFLANGERAISKFKTYNISGYSTVVERRAIAALYRISSRKALASGNRRAARTFLAVAIRQSPSLFFKDPRAIGLVILLMLPRQLERAANAAAYLGLRKMMRRQHNAQ